MKITRIVDVIDKVTTATQLSSSFKMRVSGGCIYFSNGHTKKDESFNFEGKFPTFSVILTWNY